MTKFLAAAALGIALFGIAAWADQPSPGDGWMGKIAGAQLGSDVPQNGDGWMGRYVGDQLAK